MLVIGAYALLALIVVPIYPHFVSPNEFTRWAFDAAVLESGTIEVSRHVAPFGPRFEDLAKRDGRFYMNKAPGTALITIPAHALARIFSDSIRPTLTAMRVAAATVPLLALALLFLHLGRRFQISEARMRSATWILLFATPLFAYGFLMFAHALVAAALFGAWVAIDEDRPLTAGALTGLAVSAEYTAVFAAIVLVIETVARRDSRRLLRLIAGGLPFAVGLALYHHLAFGSAFANPYSFSTEYRALHGSGLFGLGMPSPVIAAKILFEPTYGLFVLSPVLICGLIALANARRHLSAGAFRTMVAIPAVLFLVYAGYPYWYGGWNVGPRFLVPAVPFLVMPLLFRELTHLETFLAGLSAVCVTLTTLVFPFVPEVFAFPWSSLAIALLREGLLMPNLLHFAGREIAMAGLAAIVVAAAAAGLGLRRLTLAAAGGIAALAIGALWTRWAPVPLVSLQRAYIAEVYFEREGALTEASGGRIPIGLQRRRSLERQLPPATWPF